jgi:hypothetical protein
LLKPSESEIIQIEIFEITGNYNNSAYECVCALPNGAMYIFCLGKKRAHYLDKKSGLAY